MLCDSGTQLPDPDLHIGHCIYCGHHIEARGDEDWAIAVRSGEQGLDVVTVTANRPDTIRSEWGQ